MLLNSYIARNPVNLAGLLSISVEALEYEGEYKHVPLSFELLAGAEISTSRLPALGRRAPLWSCLFISCVGQSAYGIVPIRNTSLDVTGFDGLFMYYSEGMNFGKNDSATCLFIIYPSLLY
jgi:hypothetical protein